MIPKKGTGLSRTVCEPKHELKRLQKKINSRIFEKVCYPSYLQGGLKDDANPRDYVKNAAVHVRPALLVCLDIKNFYPNIRDDAVKNVFQNFLQFEPEVAEILTLLTTVKRRIPQGGCCSSYLANLIFYDYEYKVVQRLRKLGWQYSRLLDDITLSSEDPELDSEAAIKEIAALCRRFGLKLNNKKTAVLHREQGISELIVTGVWVAHGLPSLKKNERREIRQLVHTCEKMFAKDSASTEYHRYWNSVSGKVAKYSRMHEGLAKKYRERLQVILPVFDEHTRGNVIKEVKTLCSKPKKEAHRIGFIKRINRAHHALGILSRTDRRLATSLRRELKAKHSSIPTLAEYWS